GRLSPADPGPADPRAPGPGSAAVRVPVPSEQGFLADHLGYDGPGHPGQVDEVPGVHVLGGDVATPAAAAEAERERQPVARAARALAEVLVAQHARGAGGQRELLDGVVRAGVQAAGV